MTNNLAGAIVFSEDLSMYAKQTGDAWQIMKVSQNSSTSGDQLLLTIPSANTDIIIFQNSSGPSNPIRSVVVTKLYMGGSSPAAFSRMYDLTNPTAAPCQMDFALLAYTGGPSCQDLGVFVRQCPYDWFSTEVVFTASGKKNKAWAHPSTLHYAHAHPKCVVLMDHAPDNTFYGIYVIKEDQSRGKLTGDGSWANLFSVARNGGDYVCRSNAVDGESLVVYQTGAPNPLVYTSTPSIQGGSLQKVNWGSTLPANSKVQEVSILFRPQTSTAPFMIALVHQDPNGLAPFVFDSANGFTKGEQMKTLRATNQSFYTTSPTACRCGQLPPPPPPPPTSQLAIFNTANRYSLSGSESKYAAFVPGTPGYSLTDYLF